MMLTVVLSWWLQVQGRLYDADWYHRLCTFAAPLGFVAVIAGWVTTEVGRQPWTVYGLLRTADSVSPSLTGADVDDLAARLHRRLSRHVLGRRCADDAHRSPAARSRPSMPDLIDSGRPQAPVQALPRAGSEG